MVTHQIDRVWCLPDRTEEARETPHRLNDRLVRVDISIQFNEIGFGARHIESTATNGEAIRELPARAVKRGYVIVHRSWTGRHDRWLLIGEGYRPHPRVTSGFSLQ